MWKNIYYNKRQLHIEWNMYDESLDLLISNFIRNENFNYICRIIRYFGKI